MRCTRLSLLLAGSVAARAMSTCSISTIKSFLPANATVFYANHYAANATFSPPAADNAGTYPASYPLPRAGCVAQGNVSFPDDTQYSFGIVLPDEWNGRFLYLSLILGKYQ